MSVHTVSELNALKTDLHVFKKSATQLGIQSWLLPKYKLGDNFVTLTFGSEYRFDVVDATSKVKLFLQKLNRAVFGSAYDKKYKVLKSDFVFEQNSSDGWHIHMLLEQPEKANTRLVNSNLTSLIMRTWIDMNWNVSALAQKVKVIEDDLEYVIDYMTKDITKENQHQRLGII